MIVLDAGVLIAHFNARDAHHLRATEMLTAAVDEPLGASPLTLAEVLVTPKRVGRLATAKRAITDLGVVAVGLTEDGPTRLAVLRAVTGLRLPDCCVLLAAETAPASVATFDDRLAAAATEMGLPVRS